MERHPARAVDGADPMEADPVVDEGDAPAAEAPGRALEERGGRRAGPLPMVIALTVTAAGAVLLFFLPQLPLDLAQQLVEVKP